MGTSAPAPVAAAPPILDRLAAAVGRVRWSGPGHAEATAAQVDTPTPASPRRNTTDAGPLCGLYAQELRRGSGSGVQQPPRQALSMHGLHPFSARRGLECSACGYDDGGYSGGNMKRPALGRTLADVAAGRTDAVVVYKVDRLTRSLADFARIIETLEGTGAAFVSVTQAFNATTSAGRLALNVLLSFAQFEREIAGERIRDKISASKAKGMWMGGNIPLGYDPPGGPDRALIVNEREAVIVRTVFRLFVEHGNLFAATDEGAAQSWPALVNGMPKEAGRPPLRSGRPARRGRSGEAVALSGRRDL